VRPLHDPWLSGSAFRHGPDLIAPSSWNEDDWKGITPIWFLHEHPGHFSAPNYKAIPAEVRAGIAVLFHKTRDGQVAAFCRKLGFKHVLELMPTCTTIAQGVELLNRPHTDGDS
jgi:hypothetical protein